MEAVLLDSSLDEAEANEYVCDDDPDKELDKRRPETVPSIEHEQVTDVVEVPVIEQMSTELAVSEVFSPPIMVRQWSTSSSTGQIVVTNE